MAAPRIIKNFNCFVNGQGYAGLVDEAQLPELKLKTEEYRAGGMDAPVDLDMGMEILTAKITLSEHSEQLARIFAQGGQRFQLRSRMANDTRGSAVLVELSGKIKTLTPGSWKAGDMAKPEYELTLDYYRWEQGGETLWEIDVINMVRIIGGVDLLAAERSALGM